ncbi:salicylate hydroxylase [Phlyctema vagabunda]|uniref:Salicylate hydroxylase n=1 Tax=Phlyctema vagabunda TaxID=108571 RepID=A0ABR4PHM1_9HELO
MNPSQSFSLAIIGSGIGGLALAIGLRKQNVSVIIYEAAAKFDAVGAGIGLGPNALKAMELMDTQFAQMYDAIKVGNTSPDRLHEQIEILSAEEGFGITDDWQGGSVGHAAFTRSSAHRKDLLEIMQKLVPENTVRFCKKVLGLRNIDNKSEGKKVEIAFEDGEIVKFDAVIGCDGIKGMTRKVVLQESYPEQVAPKYNHVYIYRGIASIEQAKEIIGIYAEDARWWMKEGTGWAMYPISEGKEVNIVAFVQDKNVWEGEPIAKDVPREVMMKEFEGYDQRLVKLLDFVKPSRWPLYHHPDTSTYFNQRICLLGDVAHASSPSQAAGAGQGLEDALIISRLLGLVKSPKELDMVFEVYDSIRRPRAQSVVRESQAVGTQYFLVHPEFKSDLRKITEDANKRLPRIWWHDLEGDVSFAEKVFSDMVKDKACGEFRSKACSR